MTDHPITPPPELVEQWRNEWIERREPSGWVGYYLATQAARWGADQELEACCEWVSQWRCMVGGNRPEVGLRAARRPKSPSLKAQALAILDDAHRGDLGDNEMAIIRRALEALDD